VNAAPPRHGRLFDSKLHATAFGNVSTTNSRFGGDRISRLGLCAG